MNNKRKMKKKKKETVVLPSQSPYDRHTGTPT
jgi:hypothetical protein